MTNTSKAPANAGAEEVDEIEASRAPLMDHLTELRSRLIVCCVAIIVFGGIAFYFSPKIVGLLLQPFIDAAEEAGKPFSRAQYTAALEILIVQLKIAVVLGIAGAFPVIAYQVYAFVAPGLYKHERGAVAPFLIAIPFLFVAGGAIVYYVLLPLVMRFAFGTQPADIPIAVEFVPKISEYYSLAISLFAAFGLAFQLPVVLALLGKADIVSSEGLRKGRKYAIVGIFVVAMIMTPPDVFSQSVLAIPVYGLYEASILAVWMIERGRRKREAAEAKAEKSGAAAE